VKPLLALAALALFACNGSPTGANQFAQTGAGDGGDAGDAAPDVVEAPTVVTHSPPARCCSLWTTSSHPNIPAQCALMAPDADADTVSTTEPCWNANDGGVYARWTCGGARGQDKLCSNNGESCNAGDTCYLPDIGCPGTVTDCHYPWYP
jgi:hypothetical protein